MDKEVVRIDRPPPVVATASIHVFFMIRKEGLCPVDSGWRLEIELQINVSA